MAEKNKIVVSSGEKDNGSESKRTSGTDHGVSVLKTYKLYIGGKFPRTESGRYFKLQNPKGQLIVNVCQASRKDFRNAVVAARKAYPSWAGRTAYNKGQIIYRIAEMLEWRKTQFIEELVSMGCSRAKAETEVSISAYMELSSIDEMWPGK